MIEAHNDTVRDEDIFHVGKKPNLGVVPQKMHAWTLRPSKVGPPIEAFIEDVVPVPECGADEVLIYVMAAGINYNGVWAAIGYPVSVFDIHDADYHIAGSDAAGIVWKIGSSVKGWKIGDEVIVHCSLNDTYDEEANGGEPMLSHTQRIWGYETPHGSFAQFTAVSQRQLLPKPKHLSWAAASCYLLKLATAYRMLFGHIPHTLSAGQNLLVWGASGGLGSFAIQLGRLTGAKPIAVTSKEEAAPYLLSLGAIGVINRSHFDCWGAMPPVLTPAHDVWTERVKKFGSAIWKFTGKGNNPDIVFEHTGQDTFPVSLFLAKRGGMVVFCAGTSGYNFGFDARYAWMHQKRIQGSHSANLKQAAQANRLVTDGKIDPCLSRVFEWKELALAHQLMHDNKHPPGNMSVLVGASAEDGQKA